MSASELQAADLARDPGLVGLMGELGGEVRAMVVLRVLELLAARPAAAPLRVEWGVLLDDLGSVDTYDNRDQAEAARVGADGPAPLVRVETWVVPDGQ